MADRLRPDQDEIDFDEDLDEIPGALADEDDDDLDLEDEE
jgi:hypothetical protein